MGNCLKTKDRRLEVYIVSTDNEDIVQDKDGNLFYKKKSGAEDLKENYNLNRKVSELIAETKQNAIYKVQSTTLKDRNFAVKIICSKDHHSGGHYSANETRSHEEEILSKVSHRGIIGFIERYEDNVNKYIVMEYNDGPTLL